MVVPTHWWCLKITKQSGHLVVGIMVSGFNFYVKKNGDTLWESSPGPGCSKLTTSIVNVLLKFQTLISQIRQYFLLKKM